VPGLVKLACALHRSFQDWWNHGITVAGKIGKNSIDVGILGCWDSAFGGFQKKRGTPLSLDGL